ncbi:MAG: hypothetical protein GX620_15440 [Chloroflexi bacterium]|nr:hypothetical protein [Chloroflexota bacterium]
MSASGNQIKRRTFLKGMGAAAGAGLAASCAPSTPAPEAPAGATEAPAAATEAPAGATQAPAATAAPEMPAIKYGDKACVMRYMAGGYLPEGPQENRIKEIIEEALRNEYGINIDFQFERATYADIEPLITLRQQTQEVDMMMRGTTKATEWFNTPGLVRDFDAEIREYGPHLLTTIPEAGFDYYSRDGKWCSIVGMRLTPHDIDFLHIRRDWLDRIDRDVPYTIEELEECLRLFKEQNLGGDVTIPMVNENPAWVTSAMLMGPWTPEPAVQRQMIHDGIPISYRLPGTVMVEERLDYFQRLIGNGLFNPEWASWQYDQVYDAVGRGLVGCLVGGHWLTNGLLQTQVEATDPAQDWVQIFPPPSIQDVPNTGRIGAAMPIDRVVMACSWCECPEAIVALTDWQDKDMDNYNTVHYGIQGEHWDWGEGGWIVDKRSPAPEQEVIGTYDILATVPMQKARALFPPEPGKEPKDPYILQYINNNMHSRANALVPEQGEYPMVANIDRFVPYAYTESGKYLSDLEALQNEYFASIVNGELEVVAGVQQFWDAYYGAGGELFMQETVDQYDAWIAANPAYEDDEIFFAPDYWNTERKLPPPKE